MTNVSELIRSANPVPETNPLSDDEVNAVLTLTLTRSGDMDVKEIVTPVEPDKSKWSGWLVAAAAFGAVVLVAGLALLLTSSDAEELPPASAPTTAAVTETTVADGDAAPTTTVSPVIPAGQLAAVQDFLAAMSSGDEEALRASVGPAFVYSGLIGDTVFDLDAVLSWSGGLAAQRTTITAETCRLTEFGLTCNESHTGPVEDAFGVPVWWNVRYEIADGLVASAVLDECNCFEWSDAQAEIRQWVRSFAPDDADTLTSYPVFPDAAAGAAFLRYAPMWREFDGDTAAAEALQVIDVYQSAANEGDVDAFDALLAPGMTITREFDSNTVSRDGWAELPNRMIARESVLSIEDCRPKGADIECNVYRTGPIGNAVFFLSMRDKQTFTVVNGEIQNIHVNPQVWENPDDMIAVADWVATFDADAGRIMAQTWRFEDGTTESDALWLEHAPLWNEAGRP